LTRAASRVAALLLHDLLYLQQLLRFQSLLVGDVDGILGVGVSALVFLLDFTGDIFDP
jgi:hypothetical protein